MKLSFKSKIQEGDIKEGKDYLIKVIRLLSKQPTLLLKDGPSDCLNELFASWVHSIYRASIENGYSALESVEKALSNRVMCELFDDNQIMAACEEASGRKEFSKEMKALYLSKAI